jgi:proliferating cell nuclear antigen
MSDRNMKAKCSNNHLRAVVEAIKPIVDEAVFTANSEGITFRAMDASHVSLLDISWKRDGFLEYECNEEVTFGVRIDELLKLLKRIEKDTQVEISIADGEMQITASEGKRTRNYKLRLLDASKSETPVPKLSFNTRVTMLYDALVDALKDIDVISSVVEIYTNEAMIKFYGKGDAGDAEVVYWQDENTNIEMFNEVKESVTAYSLEYLLQMLNAVDADNVILEYSSKMPLRLQFLLPFRCDMQYYLAPRAE